MDLLPGFFAGYLIGYVMKYTEKYVPDGVDLIGSVVLLAPLARLIAAGLTPVVNNTLLKLVTLFKVVQTRINIYGDCSRRYHYSCWYCAIKFNGIGGFIRTNRYTYGNQGQWHLVHIYERYIIPPFKIRRSQVNDFSKY